MSANFFFDSNIFIYSYDPRDDRKQTTAHHLIREHTVAGNAVISYQVIQEFFNFALVKAAAGTRPEDAQILLEDVFRPLRIVPPSITLVSDAVRIQDRYRLGW